MASNDNYSTGNSSASFFTSSPPPLARSSKRHRTTSPAPSLKITSPTTRSYDDAYTFPSLQGSAQHGYQTMDPAALNLNPALLLNPKGYSASAPASQTGSPKTFQRPENPEALEFQFSTPNDGYAAQGHLQLPEVSLATNGYNSPQMNGFGSMIDRMNNLEQRAFVPQPKRRKTQDERDNSYNHGFGSGNGGMLASHIRENREAATNHIPLRSVETVDLTDGGEFSSGRSHVSKLTQHRR